jgi:hypothetical protein
VELVRYCVHVHGHNLPRLGANTRATTIHDTVDLVSQSKFLQTLCKPLRNPGSSQLSNPLTAWKSTESGSLYSQALSNPLINWKSSAYIASRSLTAKTNKMEPQGITLFDDMASVSSRPAFQHRKHYNNEGSFRRKRSHHHPKRAGKPPLVPRRSQSVQWPLKRQPSRNNGSDKPRNIPDQPKHISFYKPRPMPEPNLSIVEQQDPLDTTFDKPRSIPNRAVSFLDREPVDCPKDRQPSNRSFSMQAPQYPYDQADDDDEFLLAPPRRSTSIHVPNQTKTDDRFKPKRNKSIHAGFSKIQESDDIWIEQVVFGTGRKPHTHFKSMHGHVCLKEPPTGAKTIIYVEDYIVQEEDPVHDLKETAKPIPPKKENMKTKSKWKSLVRMIRPKKATK